MKMLVGITLAGGVTLIVIMQLLGLPFGVARA